MENSNTNSLWVQVRTEELCEKLFETFQVDYDELEVWEVYSSSRNSGPSTLYTGGVSAVELASKIESLATVLVAEGFADICLERVTVGCSKSRESVTVLRGPDNPLELKDFITAAYRAASFLSR